MKINLAGGAVALALTMALPTAALAQASQAEVDELKNEVRALNEKVAAMESKDSKSSWTEKVEIKADLRYRYESLDEEGTDETRERQRIRARIGVFGQVTENWELGVQFATGGDDPRSTNQTLGNGFTTKDIATDLAYARYTGIENFEFTAGKMKYPWVQAPVTYFFDGDLNPEGLAGAWDNGAFFANAHWFQIAERSQDDDSQVVGGQVGGRFDLGGLDLHAGVGYQDFIDVEGFEPCYEGNCNGNTVDANGNLVFDYNILFVGAGVTMQLGNLPFDVWAQYANNSEADEDTAYAYGAKLGNAGDAGTWEAAVLYQDVEKDALFGGYVDSDFGGGETDNRGWVFKGGYGIAKNFSIGLTYYLNEAEVTTNKHDYDRYQLDFQWKY